MLQNYSLLTLTNEHGITKISVIYDDTELVIKKIEYNGPSLVVQERPNSTIDYNKFQINGQELTFLTNEYIMLEIDDYLGGTVLEPPLNLIMYLLSNLVLLWQ